LIPLPRLLPGEVHVWRFTLDPPADLAARFEETLSDDERRRADRFHTEALRRRFVAGRGGLRAALGAYFGIDPAEVTFEYGPHGKPVLACGFVPATAFNLSHSHELALFALTSVGAVGVDLEAIRPMEEHGRRLIRRFFSPAEQAEYLALPVADRLAAFFRGWTRKEAFLKATGTGLATVLHSFDVTLGPSAPAALLRVADDPAATARWSLFDLDPGPGYAGALAVETRGADVSVRFGDLFHPPPWADR
jgi:4'-phosphopantetheinyl transferase